MKPWRRAVRVLLRQEEEVVLVRHEETGFLTLPGGGIEDGESVYEAANRELFEELGLSTEDFVINYVSPHIHYYRYPDETRVHKGQKETLLVATLKPTAKPRITSAEVAEVRFAPVDDLPYEELLVAAKKALNV